MPRIQVDATDAVVFKDVEAGTYECTVDEISDVIQGPKAKYLKATLKICSGDYDGQLLWTNLPIDGKGAGIFIDFVNKVTGSELEAGEIHDVDTDNLIGERVDAVVIVEEFEGEDRAQVKRLLKARS